jgi:hypothetical protein
MSEIIEARNSARVEALLSFLGETDLTPDDVSVDDSRAVPVLSIGRREYYVLTDKEAKKMAEDDARDSLWAFTASYICNYIGITDTRQIDAIEKMQEKLCEDAGPIIERLLGADLEHFIRNAVAEDGRGHFIASYDGEENEQGEFFIYRVN